MLKKLLNSETSRFIKNAVLFRMFAFIAYFIV